MIKYLGPLCLFIVMAFLSDAQPLSSRKPLTRQDTLRGTITPERAWWDVASYNIYVRPDYKTKTIQGYNRMEFDINSEGKNKRMQIDLQEPMQIDSIIFQNQSLKNFTREGNVFFIDFGAFEFHMAKTFVKKEKALPLYTITIYYHGKPREAINPPWDGGWIWTKDEKGRPWMTAACQGLGASVWYPCKDHQSDEPDLGATLMICVPDTLVAVGNGRLESRQQQPGGMMVYTWKVVNPINNYDIIPYIGMYTNFTDTLHGENGVLDMSYWVLDYNLEKAKKQFGRDVKRMLRAFEYWFGPYPFYEDSYKLVESSHLGMEHQSATAYGNHYRDGYLGMDLSRSGWGLKWDYIIVHESGHEWFGNNITTRDIADMWVHEGTTMYSEALFIEYFYGKQAADEYVQGIRLNISNDIPLIGLYGVNKEGSGDMYNKGANMLHTIRQVINDDTLFRSILRGLNKEFYHKTINSADYERYFSKRAGRDLSRIFDQYLRTVKIPELELKSKGDKLSFRWNNVVKGFDMPVKLADGTWLQATTEWKSISRSKEPADNFLVVDKNFYVTVKK
jgi:aminopeptidase N